MTQKSVSDLFSEMGISIKKINRLSIPFPETKYQNNFYQLRLPAVLLLPTWNTPGFSQPFKPP
jgi:hypothetical protein